MIITFSHDFGQVRTVEAKLDCMGSSEQCSVPSPTLFPLGQHYSFMTQGD